MTTGRWHCIAITHDRSSSISGGRLHRFHSSLRPGTRLFAKEQPYQVASLCAPLGF